MLIRELFESDVTRDIPPVVYFHEQRPEHLKAEVEGYIITGGYPEGHPRAQQGKTGIHEQYVRLLRQISVELDKKGGPELPPPGFRASTARASPALPNSSALP